MAGPIPSPGQRTPQQGPIDYLPQVALSVTEARRMLAQAGIDVSSPIIAKLLTQDSFLRALNGNPNLVLQTIQKSIPFLVTTGAVDEDQFNYWSVQEKYQLFQPPSAAVPAQTSIGPSSPNGPTFSTEPIQSSIGPSSPGGPTYDVSPIPGGGQYQVGMSGAIQFKNGVIVDPNGQIYFPPGKNVPGSPGWFQDIQNTWDDKKIQSWRTKLVKVGYLNSKYEHSKGFSVEFTNALNQYWQGFYQNRGKPLPSDAVAAEKKPVDLSVYRPIAKQAVLNQYLKVFGAPPAQPELDEWTDFILSTTHNIITNKGVTNVGTAFRSATAQEQNRFTQSPAVQQEVENTRLRDSLALGAQVLSGLH